MCLAEAPGGICSEQTVERTPVQIPVQMERSGAGLVQVDEVWEGELGDYSRAGRS